MYCLSQSTSWQAQMREREGGNAKGKKEREKLQSPFSLIPLLFP